MSKSVIINFAGLALNCKGLDHLSVPKIYRPFITHASTSGCEIALKVTKILPRLPDNHCLILECETWKLYSTTKHWLFTFHHKLVNQTPAQTVIFDKRFRQGSFFFSPVTKGNVRFSSPFIYPLLEVLAVPILAKHQSLLCHACGVIVNAQGFIFLGNSGDGKSTLANLWKKSATILNDDRIIVRKHGKEFWAYGTPWHGDVGLISAKGVPLQRIFFLKQGKKNSVSRKKGAEAVSMLLSRSFMPLWNRADMRCTFDLCSQLVTSVPCYELSFVPDRSIVEFVKTLPQDQ